MLSLNGGRRGLVLLQFNVPDFFDFPWEPFPVEMSGWGMEWEEAGQNEE